MKYFHLAILVLLGLLQHALAAPAHLDTSHTCTRRYSSRLSRHDQCKSQEQSPQNSSEMSSQASSQASSEGPSTKKHLRREKQNQPKVAHVKTPLGTVQVTSKMASPKQKVTEVQWKNINNISTLPLSLVDRIAQKWNQGWPTEPSNQGQQGGQTQEIAPQVSGPQMRGPPLPIPQVSGPQMRGPPLPIPQVSGPLTPSMPLPPVPTPSVPPTLNSLGAIPSSASILSAHPPVSAPSVPLNIATVMSTIQEISKEASQMDTPTSPPVSTSQPATPQIPWRVELMSSVSSPSTQVPQSFIEWKNRA